MALKARVDLMDLIGRHVELRRAAATDGGEYAGPCPFCRMGRDRFRVWPEGGRFWCRQCDRKGDAITFVRLLSPSLSFAAACQELERFAGVSRSPSQPRPPVAQSQGLAHRLGMVRAFVADCVAALWTPEAAPALEWLRARGLNDETIRSARLGWSDGREHQEIWATRGITIPWIRDDTIDAINVRQWPSDSKPKYRAVAGSRKTLFLGGALRGHADAFLTEGEFDALLLDQEAGDLVGVASLGSASDRPRAEAMIPLLGCERLFAGFDGDAAGQNGAAKLAEFSERVRLVDLPAGQDITDCWRAGGDLRVLVADALGICVQRDCGDVLARYTSKGKPVCERHALPEGVAR